MSTARGVKLVLSRTREQGGMRGAMREQGGMRGDMCSPGLGPQGQPPETALGSEVFWKEGYGGWGSGEAAC